MKSNPFFELYVGERISSDEFVTIFSPMLVEHTEALFRPGNIVVKGIQGCGKSMLLSLLKPRVRIEYENANEPFPVPEGLRKFICGSVNLAHSNVIDFGYRSSFDEGVLQTELLFADFLNYLICDSILDSIEVYLSSSKAIQDEIGLKFGPKDFDELATKICEMPVWEGWIGECDSLSKLRGRLKARIVAYRRYLHLKDRDLAEEIRDTATPIGAAPADLARLLHEAGAVDKATNIFVDIDQYEDLGIISSRKTDGARVDYRAVINKALSSRDPAISYRIGTRGYSWNGHAKIHGTDGILEPDRHFKFVDLDIILRKGELDSSRTANVFNKFALDVFDRRLRFAEFSFPAGDVTSSRLDSSTLARVYGTRLHARVKVNKVMGLREAEKYIDCEEHWSDSTKQRLTELARKGQLYEAKLGEYWIRQKGDPNDLETKDDEQLPWLTPNAQWWRKERSQIIAVKLASDSRQQAIWGGAEEILELSGGSILAFLGLNQYIWSTWLQGGPQAEVTRARLPEISYSLQSTAILRASSDWIKMIRSQSGRSAERSRFVETVGAILRKKLLADDKLTYPGRNGFSLLDSALDNYPDIRMFLEQMADYGNILMLPHTSKNRRDGPRTKFYFHPIFCPSLNIPYIRTKEPYYADIKEVAEWIYESGYEVSLNSSPPPMQEELF
ncbi:MAG: hypothetical protein GVY36_16240 [Verrucomicrobia bacterium]|jgi:hypothetical protein|nr:hypothetical protein [Verrucomicrobiota bacterium]